MAGHSKFGPAIPVEDSAQSKFGAASPVDVPSIPGMEKLGGEAPPAPRAPLADELKPEDQQYQSFVTSPHGLIRSGLRRAIHGAEQAAEPGMNPKLGGASEVIRGLGTAALPAALPMALAHLAPAAAGMALGIPAQFGVEHGARALGASPEASALMGDAAGIGAGGVGAKLMPSSLPSAGFKGAVNGAYEAAKQIPLFGKVLAIPEAAVRGYQKATAGAPFEPYRTSKATADRMRFGGPADPSYSPASAPIPKRLVGTPASELERLTPGAEPPPTTPEPAAPFKPNKAVAAKMKFGGSVKPDYQPGPSGGRIAPRGPSGLPEGVSGTKRVELHHFADMRINGRTPEPLPMYDAFGRKLPKP